MLPGSGNIVKAISPHAYRTTAVETTAGQPRKRPNLRYCSRTHGAISRIASRPKNANAYCASVSQMSTGATYSDHACAWTMPSTSSP